MFGSSKSAPSSSVPRRTLLRGALGAATAFGALRSYGLAASLEEEGHGTGATKGRIQQSLVSWCFEEYWSIEQMCQLAVQLGMKSVELVAPGDFPVLKKHGLVCAIAASHSFTQGMSRLEYQGKCIRQIRQAIDTCAEHGFPSVITFTGCAEGLSREEGLKNCVEGYKKIIGYAEEKKVNVCLEIINSRVGEYMKGQVDYLGDHTDYVMEIVRKVGSPRFKLLFDIYHVQIMDGDIIARIRQYRDYIGHYHTAGNPGRHELDDQQEINYRPIMEEIVKTGYQGYVGQEFMPSRDPLEGLREAVLLCDV